MKKMAFLALAALLAVVSVCGLAEGEGVVVSSTCNIVQDGEYYLVYCYAQVHNNTQQVICMNSGTVELHNDEQLLATEEISQLWPYFLSPGEDGYLFDTVAFAPNEDGVVIPNVTGIVYNIDYMTVDTDYGNYALTTSARIEQDAADGSMMVICEVKNETQMEAYDPVIAFGLYTEGGQLLYTDGKSLQSVGIPVGGTLLLKFPLESVFVKQWTSYGFAPATAQVIGAFRQDDD